MLTSQTVGEHYSSSPLKEGCQERRDWHGCRPPRRPGRLGDVPGLPDSGDGKNTHPLQLAAPNSHEHPSSDRLPGCQW